VQPQLGTFEFGPVGVTAAAGFGAWTRGLITAIRQLTASGEITPIPHFDDVVGLYSRVLVELDAAAAEARKWGRTTIDVVAVPMSVSEHRQLKDVGRAIESYVGLLATRGLLDMAMQPAEAAAMAALVQGVHTP
jgi:hypothetical protein